MANKQIFKGLDCETIFNKSFKESYNVLDIPFYLRKKDIEKLDVDSLPIAVNIDEESLVVLDKLYFMFNSLLKVNKDLLKHLNIVANATIKYCDLPADFIIVRHNRILLVEFCYDLTSNNNNDIKEQQVTFVMNKIENTLKKYLPIDAVVNSYLFCVRKGDNKYEIGRLAKTIDDFYSKTTNKELIKLIK